MSRNNDVSKVLVTTGNQDILAADGTLDALALGQIGIFDEKTNLAVDETSTPPQGLYFAVGVDKDGDAVKDDIEFSAGQYIQVKNTKFMSFRPHTAAQDLIVDVVDFVDGECDADYSVKIELRDQEIYRIQGTNQFTKTFSVRTPCCVGDQTAVDGNDIGLLLRDAINADESGVFTATLVARQAITIATHGTSADYVAGDVVSDADIAVVIAYNEANPTLAVYTDLRITFGSLAITNFCNVNLKYFKPRNILGIVSPLEDLVCIGAAVETAQALAFEEGSGYDIKQKEYHSQLDGNGPYVLSEATGTAKERIFYADTTVKYDQTGIESDFKSLSGWQNYSSPISTILAVPATDTVTRDALVAALDVLFGGLGFDELSSDVAAADVDPAVVEATEDKGKDDDGIT